MRKTPLLFSLESTKPFRLADRLSHVTLRTWHLHDDILSCDTADRIKGSKATVMAGIGHFPMSENPALFHQHILPVLDEIQNGA